MGEKLGVVWDQQAIGALLREHDYGIIRFTSEMTEQEARAYDDSACFADPRRVRHRVALYALVDPRTQMVRYAGQTAQPLPERLRGHIADALRNVGRAPMADGPKIGWICSLTAQEMRPRIELVALVRPEEADDFERALIAELWMSGADLLNIAETPRLWCSNVADGRERRHYHDISTSIEHDAYIGLLLLSRAAGFDDPALYLKHMVEDAVTARLREHANRRVYPDSRDILASIGTHSYALIEAAAKAEDVSLDAMAGAGLEWWVQQTEKWMEKARHAGD